MSSPLIKSFAVLALFSVQMIGCGSTDGAASSSSAKGSAAPAPAASAKPAKSTAAAPAAPSAKPVDLVDLDLGTANPDYKGWSIKAPAGAKAMDGLGGVRVLVDGVPPISRNNGDDAGWNLDITLGKGDLAKTKAGLKPAHEEDGMKISEVVTKDEPDALEWTFTVGTVITYDFQMHLVVDKNDIVCGTNPAFGAGSEAERSREIAACKSLTKKK